MNSKVEKFEYTVEGCKEAKAYLDKLAGKSALVSKAGSMGYYDGWTIVSFANNVYNKENEDNANL